MRFFARPDVETRRVYSLRNKPRSSDLFVAPNLSQKPSSVGAACSIGMLVEQVAPTELILKEMGWATNRPLLRSLLGHGVEQSIWKGNLLIRYPQSAIRYPTSRIQNIHIAGKTIRLLPV